MPIKIDVSTSVQVRRDLSQKSLFANIGLTPHGREMIDPVRASVIHADQTGGQSPKTSSKINRVVLAPKAQMEVTPTKKGDCKWTVSRMEVVVELTIRLNVAKIKRGYFDPDPKRPYGYEANAPRHPSHWKLDERNVLAHELSHANDVATAVQARLSKEFNAAGVQEQLSINLNCRNEAKAYQSLHRLVRRRILKIGLKEFERLIREFNHHKANSKTEQTARKKQIQEHSRRRKP